MNKCRIGVMAAVLAVIGPVPVVAETPEPQAIVKKMVQAAAGEQIDRLEVVQLVVESEETRNDGTRSETAFTAYADLSAIDNLRMEPGGGVVVARNGNDAWATNKGVIDERPQTPYMAKGTLNQNLFALLLLLLPT